MSNIHSTPAPASSRWTVKGASTSPVGSWPEARARAIRSAPESARDFYARPQATPTAGRVVVDGAAFRFVPA